MVTNGILLLSGIHIFQSRFLSSYTAAILEFISLCPKNFTMIPKNIWDLRSLRKESMKEKLLKYWPMFGDKTMGFFNHKKRHIFIYQYIHLISDFPLYRKKIPRKL